MADKTPRRKRKHGGSQPDGAAPVLVLPAVREAEGYPHLSLRYLQPNFGIEQLSERQRSEFLAKWAKRSTLTWKELATHDRHGLGSDQLPRREIRPQIPEMFEEDKFYVYRHDGNLPFVGTKIGDTLYVLWIEAKYGQLYKHS